MHENAAFLTLALALGVLAPIVSAQDAPGAPVSSVDVGLESPAGIEVDELAGAALDRGTATIDETLGVAVAVDVATGPPAAAPATEPAVVQPRSEATSPSAGERVAAVAAPAAGAALLAGLLATLAFGAEGLRMVQARLTDFLGRAVRAIAGAALAAVPLFSRIERGQVMDNPVRARVHEVIAAEPGLSLSEVSQRAGIAWGTTVHHLRRLETLGVVVSVSRRPHRRYFVANTPAAAQRTAMAVVMHPTARRIAEYVTQRPGTDQAGICQALGLNNPSASKHLSRFEAGGLVLSQRSGRNRHYHATGGLHSALLMLDPARPGSLLAPAPLLATIAQEA
ncbi:MAG: winged helix-turn-helix transcriptional regulator [Thermoplasmatota archaeon]